jgi:hypothetical protein
MKILSDLTIHWKLWLVENIEKKKRKLDDFLFYEFNNPFRRWINATPAEKSTSHIRHHHHSRRHLCLVECVNFKRRNKKLFFLIFSNLKKTHHHHLLCTSWSVVCLLAYISTYIYIYIQLFFVENFSYLLVCFYMVLIEKSKNRLIII